MMFVCLWFVCLFVYVGTSADEFLTLLVNQDSAVAERRLNLLSSIYQLADPTATHKITAYQSMLLLVCSLSGGALPTVCVCVSCVCHVCVCVCCRAHRPPAGTNVRRGQCRNHHMYDRARHGHTHSRQERLRVQGSTSRGLFRAYSEHTKSRTDQYPAGHVVCDGARGRHFWPCKCIQLTLNVHCGAPTPTAVPTAPTATSTTGVATGPDPNIRMAQSQQQ
jgi:hypothetical protein